MATDLYLFANCNFVPGGYPPWQAAYDELAEYVEAKELSTKTYYFGIPFEYTDDFNQTTYMFAFEVYGKKEDLYETHLTSAAMQQFLRKIPPTMTTGLDLMDYHYVAGFLDKPGDKRECAIMQDTRIIALSATARQNIIAKLEALAESIEDTSKGIYTWMAFKSADDDVGLRVFSRFQTRDDFEKAQNREDVLDFWMENKRNVKQMEWRAFLPNGKGWLHR